MYRDSVMIISIEIIFKAMRMHEIIKGAGADKKRKEEERRGLRTEL